MPLDRMPSISLGIIVHVGVVYDASYHWRTDAGELRASVGFDAGGYSNAHIQGPPAALRELAAALASAFHGAWVADASDHARSPLKQGECGCLKVAVPARGGHLAGAGYQVAVQLRRH